MTSNQTMNYYVWPRHLYSHSRTCTRSSLCRRLSRLVASLICYLLDYASVHEILALVTWFQYMSDISSHYGYLDLLYIFILHGDHDPLYIFIMEILIYLYCMWQWPHTSYCSMLIHGHCTLMYPGLLYLLVVICRALSMYCTDWMVGSSTGFFITSLLGWTYNVFRPSYDPSNLTHWGESNFYGLSCPSADSLDPMDHFCTFDVSNIIP